MSFPGTKSAIIPFLPFAGREAQLCSSSLSTLSSQAAFPELCAVRALSALNTYDTDRRIIHSSMVLPLPIQYPQSGSPIQAHPTETSAGVRYSLSQGAAVLTKSRLSRIQLSIKVKEGHYGRKKHILEVLRQMQKTKENSPCHLKSASALGYGPVLSRQLAGNCKPGVQVHVPMSAPAGG